MLTNHPSYSGDHPAFFSLQSAALVSFFVPQSCLPPCFTAHWLCSSVLSSHFPKSLRSRKGETIFFSYSKEKFTSLSSPTSDVYPPLFLALTLRPNTLLLSKTDLPNYSCFNNVQGRHVTLQESYQLRVANTEKSTLCH